MSMFDFDKINFNKINDTITSIESLESLYNIDLSNIINTKIGDVFDTYDLDYIFNGKKYLKQLAKTDKEINDLSYNLDFIQQHGVSRPILDLIDPNNKLKINLEHLTDTPVFGPEYEIACEGLWESIKKGISFVINTIIDFFVFIFTGIIKFFEWLIFGHSYSSTSKIYISTSSADREQEKRYQEAKTRYHQTYTDFEKMWKDQFGTSWKDSFNSWKKHKSSNYSNSNEQTYTKTYEEYKQKFDKIDPSLFHEIERFLDSSMRNANNNTIHKLMNEYLKELINIYNKIDEFVDTNLQSKTKSIKASLQALFDKYSKADASSFYNYSNVLLQYYLDRSPKLINEFVDNCDSTISQVETVAKDIPTYLARVGDPDVIPLKVVMDAASLKEMQQLTQNFNIHQINYDTTTNTSQREDKDKSVTNEDIQKAAKALYIDYQTCSINQLIEIFAKINENEYKASLISLSSSKDKFLKRINNLKTEYNKFLEDNKKYQKPKLKERIDYVYISFIRYCQYFYMSFFNIMIYVGKDVVRGHMFFKEYSDVLTKTNESAKFLLDTVLKTIENMAKAA